VDAALTAEVKPPTEMPTSRWPPIAAPADDALFLARIQLASRWFETVADGAIPTDATSLARRERLTANFSKAGPLIGTRTRRDLECRQLQDLLRDLPAEIELAAAELADLSQTTSRGSRREQLRHWKCALALVDPRQNDHLSMASVAALN
ncbi:hypothetical protein, partial [Pseudomonas aeruginosa]|uniref:hypothetical protein n=1 Tax=Pseudomonas aeruginosa TaxID=287 RepID=UPI002F916813